MSNDPSTKIILDISLTQNKSHTPYMLIQRVALPLNQPRISLQLPKTQLRRQNRLRSVS